MVELKASERDGRDEVLLPHCIPIPIQASSSASFDYHPGDWSSLDFCS